MEIKNRLVLIIFSCGVLVQSLAGQESMRKWQFNGNMSLSGDFYSMNADTSAAMKARRPGSVGRMVVNSTLTYGDFSLPISLMLSVGQHSAILPPFGNRSFIDFIKDPSNRVGLAPRYKWIQLLLGTQVPQYSELSVGDLPVFGAGLSLTPGLFRFSAFAGTTQLAIEEDPTRNIQGIYARKMYSGKIGIGKEEATHLYFITTLMADDTTSLVKRPVSAMPKNGLLAALDYRIKIGKQIYLKGEFAGSAYTRDSRSKVISDNQIPINLPPSIFRFQESSRFDYAGALTIAKDGKIFGIKLTGKYIGDGFVPLGYPFMQSDKLDVTINPRFNLFNSNFQLSGSFGKRINNLSGARAATTTQTIGNADMNVQITQGLSVSASFSNFDFRNSVMLDTLRVQMVTMSYSLSPTYTYTGKKNMHTISVLGSKNTFTDFNTISGALNDNDSRTALLTYLLANLNTPFTMSATLSYFDNLSSIGMLTTESANLSVGYRFFKKKLNTTAGISYTTNKLETLSAGAQVTTNLGLKYSLNKKINLSAFGSINLFKYGTERPGVSYRENLLRLSLTYKF
ncbi:MAG: hypothetical protein WCW62_11105 [Bacteroidales bacterium]|jgi:hypothetical protein